MNEQEGGAILNARITSTMLGIEDHGILTAFIYLDYGGSSQGFGGYAFDSYDKDLNHRIGSAFGIEFIRRVLEVVGVDKWESLRGQHVRARATCNKVHALGNIIEDKWFDPKEIQP